MVQNVQRQARPVQSNPTQPKERPLPRQIVHLSPVSWRREVGHIIVAIVVMMAFGVGSVWLSNRATMYNEISQQKATELDHLRNKNNDVKEQVSNLTSQGRLNKIAEKSGMTLNNQNIKNVK
ncbi:cell division protein FtsL [Weissella kandleri]|uniref:cell division protein FtsL n=1 Tax=Weissella kandleri TaxID=1616 RepID=UPI00387E4297